MARRSRRDETPEEREKRRRKRRLRRKQRSGRGFDIHFTAWASTSFFLFVINLLSGIGTPWFLYPMLGWFIGLAIHAAAVGRIGPMIRKAFSAIRGRGWFDPFGDEPPSNKYGPQALNSIRLEPQPAGGLALDVRDAELVEEEKQGILPR